MIYSSIFSHKIWIYIKRIKPIDIEFLFPRSCVVKKINLYVCFLFYFQFEWFYSVANQLQWWIESSFRRLLTTNFGQLCREGDSAMLALADELPTQQSAQMRPKHPKPEYHFTTLEASRSWPWPVFAGVKPSRSTEKSVSEWGSGLQSGLVAHGVYAMSGEDAKSVAQDWSRLKDANKSRKEYIRERTSEMNAMNTLALAHMVIECAALIWFGLSLRWKTDCIRLIRSIHALRSSHLCNGKNIRGGRWKNYPVTWI